jgi:hypothetical protein
MARPDRIPQYARTEHKPCLAVREGRSSATRGQNRRTCIGQAIVAEVTTRRTEGAPWVE